MLFSLLAGCQAGTSLTYTRAAYEIIQPGNILTLNKELVIPANLARVYLQGGQVIPANNVDRYSPNCSLEVRTIHTSAQIILPDKFKILGVKSDEEEASVARPIYAARGFLSNDDGPVSHENWVTHFYLQSANQPDVFRLSCAHWEDPPEARHLTVAEIKSAMGNYFSLLP